MWTKKKSHTNILNFCRILIKLRRNRNIQSDWQAKLWIRRQTELKCRTKKKLLKFNGLNWIGSNRKIICVKNAHFINHVTNAHFIPLSHSLSALRFDAQAEKNRNPHNCYDLNANFVRFPWEGKKIRAKFRHIIQLN